MKADNPTKKLLDLFAKVAVGRVETTLVNLCEFFPPEENAPTLEKALFIKEKLGEAGLCLIPGFEAGNFETVRCLDFIQRSGKSHDFVREEIKQSESGELEFKSSLFYDWDKARHMPQSTLLELRSEGVLHSALKSIAAFLTSNGGVLYLGVGPQGETVGLEQDFRCTNEKMPNADGWELVLRDLIKSRFKDGAMVNPYVVVEFPPIDGKTVARLQISPRTKLSFLASKDGKNWTMYRRDGNRTVEVTIDQIEEYVSVRSGYGASIVKG